MLEVRVKLYRDGEFRDFVEKEIDFLGSVEELIFSVGEGVSLTNIHAEGWEQPSYETDRDELIRLLNVIVKGLESGVSS